jgi:hypothetical protein
MIITPIPPWQVLAIIMQGGSSIISPTPQWNVDVYALRRRWYPAGWCGASQGHSQVVEAVKRLATLALLLTWCGVRCEIKR